MLLHACGGFSKTLPHHSRLHSYSEASRGLQGPPGASRGLQRPPGGLQGPPGPSGGLPKNSPQTVRTKNAPAAYWQSLEPWARLKFHVGWSGWTRPPTMAGGGGVRSGQGLGMCARGSRGGF